MRPGLLFSMAAAALAFFGALESAARADGLALSRFDPAERGSRFFVADSLDLEDSATRVNAGVVATYTARTRTYGTRTEGERLRFLDHALELHPGASVVITPGARFGLDLPVAAYQDGEAAVFAGKFYQPPSSPRLGDLRSSFDLALFGPRRRNAPGMAGAAGVSVWFPTGSQDDFLSDGLARVGFHYAGAYRIASALFAARAEYMYRGENRLEGGLPGSELRTQLAAGWSDRAWTIGPELFGATPVSGMFAKRTTPLEILLGVHHRLGGARLGAAFGTALAPGLGAPQLRAAVSLEFVFEPKASDRDHDGIADDDDACPDVFGPDASDPNSRGCPTGIPSGGPPIQ